MPFCEFCGNEISYLPFKCKYCGGTYCKKHRLPENHECTFELKHTRTVPTTSRARRPRYQDVAAKKKISDDSDYKWQKERKRYLKQQKRQMKQASRGFDSNLYGTGKTSGTTFIIIMIVIFSLIGLFLPLYLCLSVYGISLLFLWTIFTSLFISYSGGIFGLLFLFILIIFLYNIAKNIELRFGTKFFVSLYFFCAAFSGLFYILIRYLLSFYYPISQDNAVYIGLATGAMLGLISFIVYFNPNREMMLLCYFVPVKMKGKLLLIILILFRLIPGLLFGLLISPLYLAIYLPDLGGILAAYLVFRIKYKARYRRI